MKFDKLLIKMQELLGEEEDESLIAHCINAQGELDIILDLIALNDEFKQQNPEFEPTIKNCFHMITEYLSDKQFYKNYIKDFK